MLQIASQLASIVISLTCPIGEGCTIPVPNPPRSGPLPTQGIWPRTKTALAEPLLIAAFVPEPTDPPKGNPEGSGTR